MAEVAVGEREKKVEEIRKKISANQGEVVLAVRDMIVKRANERGIVTSPAESFYHKEAGEITGGLEDFAPDAKKWLDFRIEIKGLWGGGRFGNFYFFTPDLAIPVKKKIVGSGYFHLNFSPEDLKKAEKGKICFGSRELDGKKDIPGYEQRVPYLKSLNVLVGEEEIREFAGRMRVLEEKTEGFFKLFEKGEIEKRVNEYDYKNREKISGELVRKVAGLCKLEERVSRIRESVLRATLHLEADEDQRGSYGVWSELEREAVHKYYDLREKIEKLKGEIGETLREADKAGLREHIAVDGRYAGFPAEVSPAEYLENVKEIVERAKSRIVELDKHLEEARKKAYS